MWVQSSLCCAAATGTPQHARKVLANRGECLIPFEYGEAVELWQYGAIRQCERGAADQRLGRRHLRLCPDEQREILIAQVGMHAERPQRVFRHDKASLFGKLAHSGGDKRFTSFSDALGNVPAWRTRGMAEQDPAAIGHDHTTGGQHGCAAKRVVGATNSCCAATVRISREPASAVRRSSPCTADPDSSSAFTALPVLRRWNRNNAAIASPAPFTANGRRGVRSRWNWPPSPTNRSRWSPGVCSVSRLVSRTQRSPSGRIVAESRATASFASASVRHSRPVRRSSSNRLGVAISACGNAWSRRNSSMPSRTYTPSSTSPITGSQQ